MLKMYKYHCLNPIADIGINRFTDEYEMTDKIEEADAVLVRSADMNSMDLPETIKVVARAGAGVNNIPLEECAKKGIVVVNTPGANANGVKEMVIAGMLLASRDIVGGIGWVAQEKDKEDIGKLAEKNKKNFAGCEISGKKLGVIGLGAIGIQVANTAIHLGMEVYGYDPFISVDAAWNLSRSIKHINDLRVIYKECDFITIHVPAMEETKRMINKKAIKKMKSNAVILNFARDVLVDEKALVEALEADKIKKYVTDFANPTVAGKKNVIVTPHLGASTEESEDNCAVMAVKEIREYLENGNIRNSVNFPNCEMGVCQTQSRVTIKHKNTANMLAKFTAILGEAEYNITDMTNKSKGEYAYTMLDIDKKLESETLEKLKSVDGVMSIRIIK